MSQTYIDLIGWIPVIAVFVAQFVLTLISLWRIYRKSK